MKYLSLFLLLFCLACQDQTQSKQPDKVRSIDDILSDASGTQTELAKSEVKPEPKPEPPKVEAPKGPIIYTALESDYSKLFLSELKQMNGLKEARLIGNQLILNQKDTFQFPALPKIKERYVFTGKQGDLELEMTVQRLNQTTLEYQTELKKAGKLASTESGQADLAAFFFLGSESDIDDQSGEGYFCTAFSAYKNPCYTHIRLGNVADDPKLPLLGKLIKNCNDSLMNIDLDNFPTLRTQ